jgi:hypothetical protein
MYCYTVLILSLWSQNLDSKEEGNFYFWQLNFHLGFVLAIQFQKLKSFTTQLLTLCIFDDPCDNGAIYQPFSLPTSFLLSLSLFSLLRRHPLAIPYASGPAPPLCQPPSHGPSYLCPSQHTTASGSKSSATTITPETATNSGIARGLQHLC